jgi:hypothetical protein
MLMATTVGIAVAPVTASAPKAPKNNIGTDLEKVVVIAVVPVTASAPKARPGNMSINVRGQILGLLSSRNRKDIFSQIPRCSRRDAPVPSARSQPVVNAFVELL